MSISGHLDSLQRKHGALEAEIADISASPLPDQTRVSALKVKKLYLKEQIEKLKSSQMDETKH